jgi:hypothetical protein
MTYSDCCNAPIKWGDICSECGEHCDTMDEDDFDDFDELDEDFDN